MHYVLSTCVVARKLSGIGLQPPLGLGFQSSLFPGLHSVLGLGYLPLEQCQSGGFSHPLSRSALVQEMKLLGPPVQIGFRHLPAVLLPQLQEPLVGLVGVNLSSPLPARGLCSDSLGFAIPALSPE